MSGIANERPVDLIFSVVPGTTYATPKNGKVGSGKLSMINLFTKEGDLNFRFCFHDHETGDLNSLTSFRWSVFDIDEGNASVDGIKEKMEDYILYPPMQKTRKSRDLVRLLDCLPPVPTENASY